MSKPTDRPPRVPLITPELAGDALKRFARNGYLAVRALALKARRQPLARPGAIEEPGRILVIRLDRLGDVVLTTALLRALRIRFPQARVGVAVRSAFAPLLRVQPYLDEVIEARDQKRIKQGKAAAWDVILDPLDSYSLASARLAAALRPGASTGYAIAGRGVFFTHPAPPPALASLTEQSVRLASTLGWQLPLLRPQLELPEEARRRAADRLAQQGNKPWLVVAVGGHYPTQRLPSATMGEAAGRIAQEHGLGVVVVGGPGEGQRATDVAAAAMITRSQPKPVIAANLTVMELAALLAQARLVFANNSGPLHLAAALGVPTLSTLGPTDPVRFAPVGSTPEARHRTIRLGVACSPCNLGKCSHHTCLAAIQASRLVEAAQDLLTAGRKG